MAVSLKKQKYSTNLPKRTNTRGRQKLDQPDGAIQRDQHEQQFYALKVQIWPRQEEDIRVAGRMHCNRKRN